MPRFTSQQDRAQKVLVEDCGFRPGPSPGSASSFSSSEQSTPPKLVPIFKRRRPSRQADPALLRLREQKVLLPGTSQETSQWTRMTFPAHNLVSPKPGQPRLWVPPAATFRCPLKTTSEQGSDSSSQVSLSHL